MDFSHRQVRLLVYYKVPAAHSFHISRFIVKIKRHQIAYIFFFRSNVGNYHGTQRHIYRSSCSIPLFRAYIFCPAQTAFVLYDKGNQVFTVYNVPHPRNNSLHQRRLRVFLDYSPGKRNPSGNILNPNIHRHKTILPALKIQSCSVNLRPAAFAGIPAFAAVCGVFNAFQTVVIRSFYGKQGVFLDPLLYNWSSNLHKRSRIVHQNVHQAGIVTYSLAVRYLKTYVFIKPFFFRHKVDKVSVRINGKSVLRCRQKSCNRSKNIGKSPELFPSLQNIPGICAVKNGIFRRSPIDFRCVVYKVRIPFPYNSNSSTIGGTSSRSFRSNFNVRKPRRQVVQRNICLVMGGINLSYLLYIDFSALAFISPRYFFARNCPVYGIYREVRNYAYSCGFRRISPRQANPHSAGIWCPINRRNKDLCRPFFLCRIF